ncbi:hypothetical protein [Loktanella sp. 5RATIMAR09]|uniref:hypothetical protein n=1 Tax=Loktanella sp. 5RATIMAR09 TaxID=1225655 RepID=UPI0006EBCFD7|nr:hypothetical protein [Loktanella sp. 5RATIMAR09]
MSHPTPSFVARERGGSEGTKGTARFIRAAHETPDCVLGLAAMTGTLHAPHNTRIRDPIISAARDH